MSHYSPHPQRTDYHHPQSVSVTTAISHPWVQWNSQRIGSSPLVFCLFTCVMAEGGGGGGGLVAWMAFFFFKQKGDKSLSSGLSVLHAHACAHTPVICLWLHTQAVWFAAAQMSALFRSQLPARLSWLTCPAEQQSQGRRWRSARVTEVAVEVQSKLCSWAFRALILQALQKDSWLKSLDIWRERVRETLIYKQIPKLKSF